MIEGGQNIFDATPSSEAGEATQASDSSTETKETPAGQGGDDEAVPKDLDNKTALHKDARFRRVVEERNRLRRELDEARTNTRQEPAKSEPSKTQAPEWFKKYFGDDKEAWDGFQQMNSTAKGEAKAEALAELKREQESSGKESARWESWVSEQVEALEDEGEAFEKNALLKVMDEYKPTDEEGNLDFRKGLELLRLKSGKASNVADKRKAGALANGGSKTGSEPGKKNFVTPSDIKKWRQTGEL
jgi:hypothetical protein